MQLLGGIEEFKIYYCYNSKKYEKIMDVEKKSILSYVTSRLYYNFYYEEEIKKKQLYSGMNFLTILNELTRFLHGAEKTNINDIFTFILYVLHDEDIQIIKKVKDEQIKKYKYNRLDLAEVVNNGINFMKKENNSIVTDTLNYSLKQIMECPTCNNKYNDLKSFPTFILDIGDVYSEIISSGKKLFSLKDCLDFEINKNRNLLKFYCDSCHSYKESKSVNYKFNETNKKLIFLLKRDAGFNKDNYSMKVPFQIDEKIDLKDYMFNPNINDKYELTCVISSEIEEKRYVCFLKSYINNKWYLYVDESIEERNNIEDILNEHNNKFKYIPYILMYSKIN